MTPESKAITSLMLPTEDVDYLENPKSSYNPSVLLSREIYLDMIEPLRFGEVFSKKNFSIFFFPAGHILGAAMIAIDVGDYKILYTGDFSDFKQFSVGSCKLPDDFLPDILISESTYGFKNSYIDTVSKSKEEFLSSINNTLRKKGAVLLPAFAVGRSQELALFLSREIKEGNLWKSQIIMAGSSVQASYIYEEYGVQIFNKHIIPKNEKKISKDTPKIIISSSGMLLERSNSSRYAFSMIPEKRNSVIFTGYLDPESPGFGLKNAFGNKEKHFLMYEKETELKATVKHYSFSAHVDRDGIIGLLQWYMPEKTVFVHGFPDKDPNFSLYSEAEQYLNSDAKVFQAFNGSPILLN